MGKATLIIKGPVMRGCRTWYLDKDEYVIYHRERGLFTIPSVGVAGEAVSGDGGSTLLFADVGVIWILRLWIARMQ